MDGRRNKLSMNLIIVSESRINLFKTIFELKVLNSLRRPKLWTENKENEDV